MLVLAKKYEIDRNQSVFTVILMFFAWPDNDPQPDNDHVTPVALLSTPSASQRWSKIGKEGQVWL